MDFLKIAALVIVAAALGVGFGYALAPDKIKIEEKIVEREVTKKEDYLKNTKEYDPATGKVVKETNESGTKVTNSETTKTDKTTEKEKTRKLWAAKGGVAINPRDLNAKIIPRVGAEVRLPIFDSWAGIEADVNLDKPLLGAYLRVEF